MKRLLIASLILAVTGPKPFAPATAQDFGIGRAIQQLHVPRVRELEELPKRALRDGRVDRVLRGDKFRKAFGSVVVATVGVTILGKLSSAERRDVSERALRAVRADTDREVVETYETNKGRRKVTIKASPAQPKTAWKDDPALNPDERDKAKDGKDGTSAKTDGKDGSEKKAGEPAKSKEEDSGTVAFDDVPEATKCRRVETQIADAATSRSDAEPSIETNLAVVCELSDNDWKPVKKREGASKG